MLNLSNAWAVLPRFSALSEFQKRNTINGGTFDPIHNGHITVAKAAQKQFGIERMLMIPCGDPVHKQNKKVTPFSQRFKMIQLAFENDPSIEILNIESKLPQPNYTINTMRSLFKGFDSFFKRTHERIPFIIGVDALKGLGSWGEGAKALAENLLFLVAPRNGEKAPTSIQIDGQTLPLQTEVIQMPELGLSSTQVREKVRQGIRLPELSKLMPPKVAAFILQNKLYQTNTRQ
jgi:nicotinate-nucleotide adenylyltransferase